MVVVASRPVATGTLRNICQACIEVVSLSKNQIYSYIKTYHFPHQNIVNTMRKCLDQHPNVLHMCYLPVHAAMIYFLFSKLEGDIPHREIQIYELFTIATLLRHRAHQCADSDLQVWSLRDLCGEEKYLYAI